MEKAGICRYFQKGNCKLKGNCPYVHKKQLKATCKYYQQGNCKFGDQCNFYHPPRKVQTQPIQIVQKRPQVPKPPQQAKPKPTSQELQKQKQDNAQKIKAINSMLGLEEEKQVPPVVNYAKRVLVSFTDLAKSPEGKENTLRINSEVYKDKPYLEYLKQLTDPVLKQQAQIMRRYQYSFIQAGQNVNSFFLRLSPIIDGKQMKLNFDIAEKCLELQGQLRPYRLQIVNKSIPQYFRMELNSQINSLLQTRNIYQTLKHIQNYFEKICDQVDFILENKRFNEKDLAYEFDGGCEDMESSEEQKQDRRPPKKALKMYEQPPQQEVEVQKPKKSDAQTQQAQDNHRHEEQEKEEQGAKQKQIIPDVQLNHSVTVQTLESNCQSLLIEQLLVHLLCECSAMLTYIVKAKKRKSLVIMSKIKCSKCKQVITIYTKRQIMHRLNQNKIADMGCDHAKIEQVGAVVWKVNCSCQNVIVSNQLSLSGIRKIIKCFDCFRQYFVLYYGIFIDLPEKPQERSKMRMEKPKDRYKLDTELPQAGACKHYKYSFRWLRFACCGRAFACDKCHEDNTQKHDYDRANVMICGFCSYEQPVDGICRRCKKQLVKGTEKSGHWQGGKGCRNQALLSRNDPKKYTGLTKQANQSRKDRQKDNK